MTCLTDRVLGGANFQQRIPLDKRKLIGRFLKEINLPPLIQICSWVVILLELKYFRNQQFFWPNVFDTVLKDDSIAEFWVWEANSFGLLIKLWL